MLCAVGVLISKCQKAFLSSISYLICCHCAIFIRQTWMSYLGTLEHLVPCWHRQRVSESVCDSWICIWGIGFFRMRPAISVALFPVVFYSFTTRFTIFKVKRIGITKVVSHLDSSAFKYVTFNAEFDTYTMIVRLTTIPLRMLQAIRVSSKTSPSVDSSNKLKYRQSDANDWCSTAK